jgi:hypothetical protein
LAARFLQSIGKLWALIEGISTLAGFNLCESGGDLKAVCCRKASQGVVTGEFWDQGPPMETTSNHLQEVRAQPTRSGRYGLKMPNWAGHSQGHAEINEMNTRPAKAKPPIRWAAPADTGNEPATIGDCMLVIDDDATARELIANHLREEGFAVVTANGGRDGLKRAEELHPIKRSRRSWCNYHHRPASAPVVSEWRSRWCGSDGIASLEWWQRLILNTAGTSAVGAAALLVNRRHCDGGQLIGIT